MDSTKGIRHLFLVWVISDLYFSVVSAHVCFIEQKLDPATNKLRWAVPRIERCFCQRLVAAGIFKRHACAKEADAEPWFIDDPIPLVNRKNWTPEILDDLLQRDECSVWSSEWSSWGTCSTACGEGTRKRTKECINYVFTAKNCDGVQPIDSQTCNNGRCHPEWKLVFKAVAEIVSEADFSTVSNPDMTDPRQPNALKRDPFLVWNRNAPYNEDHPIARQLNTAYKDHYKSTFAVDWESKNITKVKLALLDSTGNELIKLEFNAVGSNRLDWFSKDRLLLSPWNDVMNTNTKINGYFFSAIGHSDIGRRWFMSKFYNHCPGDKGWMIVVTLFDAPCDWEETTSSKPNFLYSSGKSAAIFDNKDIGKADMLAIFVRTNATVMP